ncbi:MAG: hypothetical protein ACRBCI_06335 [Cellvibrionaceae bacterium]
MTTLRYQSENIRFPMVLIDSRRHRIEFYRKSNDDQTYTLIAFSGYSDQLPDKKKSQGPYHHAEQISGMTSAIVAQLYDQGYQIERDLVPVWSLVAQGVSNRQQIIRNKNAGNYTFDANDVYLDF